jgi:hypothetical protein
MEGESLEPIYRSTDTNELEVLRLALESEGIPSMIEGEHQAGLTGILPARLLVMEADVDRARKVLRTHGREPL